MVETNKHFRTRQAPSPTGYLHLGTARQMLFTALFAIKNQGIWYLRLEDTDRARLQEDSVSNMLETLKKLSLLPDEGVIGVTLKNENNFYGIIQKGDYAPYVQSERLELYHKHAQELIDKKLAYWSYLSPENKADLQQQKQLEKKPIDYFLQNILKLPEYQNSSQSPAKLKQEAINNTQLFANVKDNLDNQNKPVKPVLMYKIQRKEIFESTDLLLGQTSFDLSLEEDFVILKSDGYPTYHLAHLVDDYLMKTSLVLRAQEWYPSIVKHQVMFSDFWGKNNTPEYLHIPVILGETGTKKLSKRDGNVNMAEYLEAGYLPEAIINYLAFLGWNPGTDKELYLSPEDIQNSSESERIHKLLNNICVDFTIDTISKSPARFGLQKLIWFNREYIKMLTLDQYIKLSKNYIIDLENINDQKFLPQIKNRINISSHKEELQFQLAMLLDKNRIENFSQIGTESECILNWRQPTKEDITWRKSNSEESISNLKNIQAFIIKEYPVINQNLPLSVINYPGKITAWETVIKTWLIQNNYDTGAYLWPLRVVLSGLSKSPSPFEILSILDLDQINKRISSLTN